MQHKRLQGLCTKSQVIQWNWREWYVEQMCLQVCTVYFVGSYSSSGMCVMNHNWSVGKQHLHPQSAAVISHHSVLSEDRILQCGTSSESCRMDTDQCLKVAISFCRHHSVPVPCKNGPVETTIAEGGQNPVAGLWRPLGGNWPLQPTSSYASIVFWCRLVASPATVAPWMSVIAMVG